MAYATARFAQNGFHPTSVAEITEGLGVGKGVFYWYFDSKEELLRAILADAQLDLRRRQRAAVSGAATPSDGIEAGLRASMAWSIEHPDFFRLFQFAATYDRFNTGLRKGEQVAVQDAARHVAAAMAEGQVPDGDPVLLAHAMLGVASHLARVYVHEQGRDGDELADAAVAFCMDGLHGRSPRR